MGERLICIQEVSGSIPLGSTIYSCEVLVRAGSSAWLERTPDKREVGGSSPPRPTIYFVNGDPRFLDAVSFADMRLLGPAMVLLRKQ